MYYSPLRYPGGKGKLKTVMKHMLECSGKQGGTFIEPFAGGAAVSLSLLLEGTVSHIVLNDKDKQFLHFGLLYLKKLIVSLTKFTQFLLRLKSGRSKEVF